MSVLAVHNAVIFRQQYESMLEMGMLDGESQELRKYLNRFASMGEYDHKEDQPFYKELLSNVLDLTIIKPIIESSCGYDLITGEDLTEMERSMKLVGAIVDLVTLATGLYGFSTAVKTMGGKKATVYFAQLTLVELASDVSAATVATIGEHYEWPAFVTLLLSLGAGITVGQVGNHLIFKRNGIEIFRKEVGESGGILDDNGMFFEDLMSPEDAVGFRKADDYLALDQRDYDDVLALRRGATESGLDTIEVSKTDLDALRNRLAVPEADTIAVGKTNVKGLENVIFEGQSPRVRSEAGLPDLDEIWAGRNIKSPGNNPLFTRHAEEVLANNFDRAVLEAEIDPQDVAGVLKMRQSNPTGVCNKCVQGLANDKVSPGVLKQLSLKYPHLRIEVMSETLPDVKVTGKSNFVIQNGQYVE